MVFYRNLLNVYDYIRGGMCHTSPLMYPIYVLGRYSSGVNVRFTICICFFVAIYLSVCLIYMSNTSYHNDPMIDSVGVVTLFSPLLLLFL